MNDFTFPCPVCGQHILCAPGSAGQNVTCPACRSVVTVPGAPTDFPSPFSTATPTPTVPGTSGLAIASLVCSLFFCIGCIPAIICGHLARGRIKRDPGLSGGGLAVAGLVIGYLSLLGSLGVVLLVILCMSSPTFMRGFRQGYNESRARRLANSPYTVVPHNPGADDPELPPGPLWNLNLTTADFPDQPAAGRIRGQDFTVESAELQGSTMQKIVVLRQNTDTRDCQVMFSIILRPGQTFTGRNFDFSPANSDPSQGPSPQITISLKTHAGNGTQSQTTILSSGYALKLQIGEADADGKIPGKIYLCLPDKSKSYVAGSFILEPNKAAPKRKPKKKPSD